MNLRHAFTLVEVLVALAIGLVVATIAFTGVSLTAKAIATANRLAERNQAIRVGILTSLNELDFWTSYDNPHDAAEQPLRRTSVESPSYGANLTLGHPFTPLAAMPRVDYDPDASPADQGTWQLRPRDALLASASDIADPNILDSRDQDRGWDAWRPYQANDPRRWFQGDLVQRPHSDLRFGRYAISTNRARRPTLGFGADPRIPWRVEGWDTTDFRPGAQCDTGSFGLLPLNTTHGYRNTWLPNQLAFLHDAMGSYALAEYAPANTIMASYGADLPVAPPLSTERFVVQDASGRTHVSVDEHLDWRLGADLENEQFGSGYSMISSRMAPAKGWSPLLGRTATGNTAAPMGLGVFSDFTSGSTLLCVPTTIFNGSAATGNKTNSDGFRGVRKPAYAGDNFALSNMDPSIDEADRLRVQRTVFLEPWAIGPKIQTLMNRATMQRPLFDQLPQDWPQMDLVVGRYLSGGRWIQWAGLRWIDRVDQGESQLVIMAPGTTLRGARQQRRPGVGWAVYYGFQDPRNSPTLDSAP